jgi:hypothetical protein
MSTISLGRVKKVQDDTFLSQCCRGSGQIMAPAQDCKPSMPSFEPRTFPPPSLTGVPIEYIVGQLHNFATQYWDKPETADCTISMLLSPLTFLHSSFLTSFQSFLSLIFTQYLNCLHCRQFPFSRLHFRSAQAMVTKPL